MYSAINITPFLFSTGQRCDRHGIPVLPGTPPEVQTINANNDWSPFGSRVGFKLAEFMFADAQLSRRKIKKLLELLAAALVPHGDSPPITNRQDLHWQIDAIKLGNVQWESTCIKYNGPCPEVTCPPEWKTAEYEVWHRNLREVIKHILSNADFDGHIDYVAYQEFDGEKRQYSNMMSGDWASRQSVCFSCLMFLQVL